MSQPTYKEALGELFEECEKKVCDNLFTKRFTLEQKMEIMERFWSKSEIEDFAKKRLIDIVENTEIEDLDPSDRVKVGDMIEAEAEDYDANKPEEREHVAEVCTQETTIC